MKILPLDQSYIIEASILADTQFSYARSTPSEDFKASLDPLLFRSYQDIHKDTASLKYWVAIDENDGTVAGTTGLYELKEDQHEASWVGWFCVSPRHRGQGIGKRLLHFTINQATINGKNFLRLYTSRHRKEREAQFLYEAYGFKISESIGKSVGKNSTIFYREKMLDTVRQAGNKDIGLLEKFLINHIDEHNELLPPSADTISKYINDAYLFIAMRDEKIIGVILGEKLKDSLLLLRLFHVTDICRNQGIGTQLLISLEQECRQTNIRFIVGFAPITDMKTTLFFSNASFTKGELFRKIGKDYP